MANPNQIRLSGINSGLDTEAMVEAMTAATKLKITKQERKQITLKWKQEAYQDVTSKLTDMQNKYFDILNSKVNLKSKATYNKYSASVMNKVNGVYNEGAPLGVTVKTNANAIPASYDVKVLKTATQATFEGASMNVNSIDLSQCTDSSQLYSFSLNVDGKTKAITFNGGSEDELKEVINNKLMDAFGKSNKTAETGVGLVYINESGNITSAGKGSVKMSKIMTLEDDANVNLRGLTNSGTNKLNITVGDQAHIVTFDSYTAAYLNASDNKAAKEALEKIYAEDHNGRASSSTDELAKYITRKNYEQAFADAGVSVDASGRLTANNGEKVAVTADKSSANSLGLETTESLSTQVDLDTTLKELGITENATININGVDFTFTGDYTIRKMMNEINANKTAGANLTFSSLTNSFSIKSSEYGTAAKLDFSGYDDTQGNALLSALGLDNGTFTAGSNLELQVNDQVIETSSNAYTVDGVTMTFAGAAEGTEIHIDVKKDNSAAIDAIKSFVEDYNKLIEEVWAKLDEKPDKDYYALADSDIEDMDLSEKQQEKWEEKAKLGLLYNDSAVSKVMQNLRNVIYSTNLKTADGQNFNLFSMGIKTSSEWEKHGQLEIDEDALTQAFELYGDQIEEFLAGTTVDEDGNRVNTGLMYKFDDVLTSAVKATGKNKGSLVQLAGLKTGTSVTNNSIYDQLKSISTLISQLQTKYENQQDRYWKQFSNLETAMGSLNNQTSYIQQLMNFQ